MNDRQYALLYSSGFHGNSLDYSSDIQLSYRTEPSVDEANARISTLLTVTLCLKECRIIALRRSLSTPAIRPCLVDD